MPGNEDRTLENIIRGSEELIRDLEAHGVRGQAEAGPARLDTPDVETHTIAAPGSVGEPATDGTVHIAVSGDEMLVHASFHPPTGAGKPVSLDAAREAIEGKGITCGVDWEAIKGCILTCNEQRVAVTDIVVARGRKPVDETPPYLVIAESLLPSTRNEERAGARVDFKELSLFVLVKKGAVLATLMPKRLGAMGITVRGAAVAFRKEPVSYPRPGRNTQLQSDKVIALCDGRFQATIDSFWVDEVLDIPGDVDFHVGNVDFPGDIVIHGEVRDGFAVKAGKSILCVGSIGAARIECAGDLITRQGIIGKEKAALRVGGATEAKFIEGCALVCEGPVRVKTSVMSSTIHTRDRLEMASRGIIIGGVVKAQNGVSAAQIGTERGPRTEIHCGIDFKVEQKLLWIRDRNIALATRLKEIDVKMKTSPETRTVLSPLRQKVKTAIHQLNENARALVSHLDRNEGAAVSVRETVYPGTYIEICHVSYFVTKPRRFTTFRLDKASGKITETAWEPRAEAYDAHP